VCSCIHADVSLSLADMTDKSVEDDPGALGREHYPSAPRKGRSRKIAPTEQRRYRASFTTGFPDKMRRRAGVLLPKETGAIAQILTTLVATVSMVPNPPPAGLTALAALALFFAHEPFMIVTNLRGARARHENAAEAWRQLVIAPLFAITMGVVAALMGPANTVLTYLIPGIPAAVLMLLVFGRLEKTFEGELLVAITIGAFGFPVAYAGGAAASHAAAIASVWVIVLCVATMAVRRVTARAKSAMTFVKFIAPIITGVSAIALLDAFTRAGVFPVGTAATPVPVLLFSFWITLRPPHLRHIRKVGWTMAVCLLLTCVSLVAVMSSARPQAL